MSNIKLGDYSKGQTGIVYNNVSTILVKDENGESVQYYLRQPQERSTTETFTSLAKADGKAQDNTTSLYTEFRCIKLLYIPTSIFSVELGNNDISSAYWRWLENTNVIIFDNAHVDFDEGDIVIKYYYIS